MLLFKYLPLRWIRVIYIPRAFPVHQDKRIRTMVEYIPLLNIIKLMPHKLHPQNNITQEIFQEICAINWGSRWIQGSIRVINTFLSRYLYIYFIPGRYQHLVYFRRDTLRARGKAEIWMVVPQIQWTKLKVSTKWKTINNDPPINHY